MITVNLMTDHSDLNWILMDFEALPRIGETLAFVTGNETVMFKVYDIVHILTFMNGHGYEQNHPQVKAKVL